MPHCARAFHGTECRMLGLDDHVAGERLLVGVHLQDIEHRACRYAGALQQGHARRVARPFLRVLLHQALPLIRRRILEEGAGLGDGWDASGEVEVDAPQESAIVGQGRRLDAGGGSCRQTRFA